MTKITLRRAKILALGWLPVNNRTLAPIVRDVLTRIAKLRADARAADARERRIFTRHLKRIVALEKAKQDASLLDNQIDPRFVAIREAQGDINRLRGELAAIRRTLVQLEDGRTAQNGTLRTHGQDIATLAGNVDSLRASQQAAVDALATRYASPRPPNPGAPTVPKGAAVVVPSHKVAPGRFVPVETRKLKKKRKGGSRK